jgi:hypothetical protein
MTAAQIKVRLEKQIGELSPASLKELYGMLVNFFNGKQSLDEWASMSSEEKAAIEDGLQQLNKGKRIPRQQAMTLLRKRQRG